MDKINSILEKIEELQKEVNKLVEDKNGEQLEWYATKDCLEIKDVEAEGDYILLRSNYDTWEDSKKLKDPLYIEITNRDNDCFISMELEDIIELRDYLNQKIDYLSI